MKVIFEKDEDEDFLEVILTEEDLRDINLHDALDVDIPSGIKKSRNLNICVRKKDALDQI